jgi:hypothetical protein
MNPHSLVDAQLAGNKKIDQGCFGTQNWCDTMIAVEDSVVVLGRAHLQKIRKPACGAIYRLDKSAPLQ